MHCSSVTVNLRMVEKEHSDCKTLTLKSIVYSYL